MLNQTFIATTKSGIKIEVVAQNTAKKLITTYPTKCVQTAKGAVNVISLNRKEAKELCGVDKEALVIFENQKEWKQFEYDCNRERYDLEQAAPKTLIEERQRLVSIEYNLYSAEYFPGSKPWNRWNEAVKVLRAFDVNHPEVKQNLKSKPDNFIPTENSVDL